MLKSKEFVVHTNAHIYTWKIRPTFVLFAWVFWWGHQSYSKQPRKKCFYLTTALIRWRRIYILTSFPLKNKFSFRISHFPMELDVGVTKSYSLRKCSITVFNQLATKMQHLFLAPSVNEIFRLETWISIGNFKKESTFSCNQSHSRDKIFS